LVGRLDPEEGQVPDILAYLPFQLKFVEAAFPPGAAPLVPLRELVVESVTLDERLSDALSEPSRGARAPCRFGLRVGVRE
jgi:hypothetical protein